MKKPTVRHATAAALSALACGAVVLAAAPAASAAPAARACSSNDVVVRITQDRHAAAGHHADAIHYTAATPSTSCVLQGAPTDTVFYDDHGAPLGVDTATAAGESAPAVVVDAAHPAVSYAVIPNSAQPGPNSVRDIVFTLPTGRAHQSARAIWPANDLTEGTVRFGTVSRG